MPSLVPLIVVAVVVVACAFMLGLAVTHAGPAWLIDERPIIV